MEQFMLLGRTSLNVELKPHMLVGLASKHVLHQAMMTLKDSIDLVADFLDVGSGDLVALQQEFDVEGFFHVAQQKKSAQHDGRGKYRGEIKTSASGHTNRSDHEDGSRGR